MAQRLCPGLPTDWLQAWLAAIGATVLVDGMTLAWSDDPVPLAILDLPGVADPGAAIQAALPSAETIGAMPIRRDLAGHMPLNWNIDVSCWHDRASVARTSSLCWTLTSAYSDLACDRGEFVIGRGQFATPMPNGLTLHDRLTKLVAEMDNREVDRTLDGTASRCVNNGLGFDIARVGSLADSTELMVDPVLEMLAFFGLALFPVRGSGRSEVSQRGWLGARSRVGSFEWFAWSQALDTGGIDALLDCVVAERTVALRRSNPATEDQRTTSAGRASRRRLERLGVTGSWTVVPYEKRGKNDQTRAYGSQRVS